MIMHKRFLFPLLAFSAMLMFVVGGCRKTEDLTDRVNKMDFIGDNNQINGPIDEWLFQKFTIPYNIKIQYRWNRSEVDLAKMITPIDESKVIPVAEKILKFYLEPYQEEGGDYFIKRYPPKEFLFVGSAEYNTNGTVTLGSADAGRKISLFRLNEIDDNNWEGVQRMLKTIHHEFTHILNQNRAVTPEYGAINKADYVEDAWNDFSEQQGLDLGFITPYARSLKTEDFAEMAAVLLVYGQHYFDSLVYKAAPQGQVNLRKKEQMLVDYFKSDWNIDFRSLQARIQDLMPPPPPPVLPPFLEHFGDGLEYTEIQIDDTDIGEDFRSTWNSILEEMVTESDRHIAYFKLSLLPGNTQMLVRVYRYAAGAGQTGSVSYSRLYFDITQNGDGSIRFTYAPMGEDGKASSSAIKANSDVLSQFLEGNNFVWDWLDSNLTDGGLFVVDNSGKKTGVAFTGVLQN